jgi:RNAse (barnase) inhibitor barstar
LCACQPSARQNAKPTNLAVANPQLVVASRYDSLRRKRHACALFLKPTRMSLLNKDIADKWNNGETVDWRLLNIHEKKEWLLACLFRTGLPKGTLEKREYIINGDEVQDPVDLYCHLGHIFIGDKGYMGQDLDGLDDCFVDLKVTPGATLIIKNHQSLALTLNKTLDNYFSMLVDILKEHGFDLKLE